MACAHKFEWDPCGRWECDHCGLTPGQARAREERLSKNPRVQDLTLRTDRAPRPTSDRERVDLLRADPVARFDEPVMVRKLPMGVVP